MSNPTTVTCTLQLKDFLSGTNFTTAELVCTPRKSFMENSNLIIGRQVRATADVNGLCTLSLVESTTPGQQVVFTLNYQSSTGGPVETIVFDPVQVPSTNTDLSTILTVARG